MTRLLKHVNNSQLELFDIDPKIQNTLAIHQRTIQCCSTDSPDSLELPGHIDIRLLELFDIDPEKQMHHQPR